MAACGSGPMITRRDRRLNSPRPRSRPLTAAVAARSHNRWAVFTAPGLRLQPCWAGLASGRARRQPCGWMGKLAHANGLSGISVWGGLLTWRSVMPELQRPAWHVLLLCRHGATPILSALCPAPRGGEGYGPRWPRRRCVERAGQRCGDWADWWAAPRWQHSFLSVAR